MAHFPATQPSLKSNVKDNKNLARSCQEGLGQDHGGDIATSSLPDTDPM